MKYLYILLIIVSIGCKNESSEQSRLAILVSQDQEISHEEYFNGNSKDDLVNVQSITKSVVGVLIGKAIDDRVIESEDVSIGKYFPNISDEKKSITIKNLLNHTSGLQWEGYLEHEEYQNSSDPINYVLSKKLIADPGVEYNYNSGATHLLSVILTKASGKSTLEFAQEHLFNPLAIESVSWNKLQDGYYDGAGFSLEMLPSDLVKIGGLFIDVDQDVISIEWLSLMKNEELKMDTRWGLRKSKHGYGWYSSNYKNEKIIYSMGYGGQFILIKPSTKTVIVCAHNHDTPEGISQQVDFLRETFPELLASYNSSKKIAQLQ